jgi:hypothetical protein
MDGHLKKIFRTYQNNFPDISHVFLNIKKNFQIYDIFPENEKHFWHFSRKKRALSSRKKGTWQNLGGLPPPGSYAPESMVHTIKVSVITVGILHRSILSFEGFVRNIWGNWFRLNTESVASNISYKFFKIPMQNSYCDHRYFDSVNLTSLNTNHNH